jgi:predicted Zn-dependent protease
MNKNLLLAALLSLIVLACHKNAVTGKRSLTLLPESEMMGMSYTQYDQFLKENNKLPESDERVKLVKGCGEKIQKAVETYYAQKGASKDLVGFKWEFNVVDDPTINAWCMPGGKVVFYTGILPLTQDENGLAIVMGHEIAHAVARHGNQRMSQGILAQTGGAVLSVALSQKPAATQQLFMQSFGMGSQLGILKFSRSHETEADKMGLIFAAMGGYNPEAAVPFWQRMAAQSGGQKPPEFMSTHPSDDRRISDLKAFMPEALKYYKPQ